MTNEDLGRQLVALRKRVDARCLRCTTPFTTRLKGGQPERSFCSNACRMKAYYENHKAERAAYQKGRRAARPAQEAES